MLIAQSCLTFCDPMDCSLPGSSVHGILQARILEWVVFPSLEDLPNPGIKSGSPALQADSLPAELPGKPMGKVDSKQMGAGDGKQQGSEKGYRRRGMEAPGDRGPTRAPRSREH